MWPALLLPKPRYGTLYEKHLAGAVVAITPGSRLYITHTSIHMLVLRIACMFVCRIGCVWPPGRLEVEEEPQHNVQTTPGNATPCPDVKTRSRRILLRLQHSANRSKWVSSIECALYVHTEQQHWTSHHEVPKTPKPHIKDHYSNFDLI